MVNCEIKLYVIIVGICYVIKDKIYSLKWLIYKKFKLKNLFKNKIKVL